ncbi:MAG: hypothetical protein HYW14_01245, partial [Planctomycetes bacterium]|nr:hypothetical protein [Planctomycetota bacterium]
MKLVQKYKYTFLICLFLLSSFCIPNSVALAKYAAHDIAVTQIGFEEQTVESGDVVFLTVTVEVENKGTEDAQNVPITVYVGEEVIAQDTIPYLLAGETFNLSYGWAISAEEIPFKSNIRAEIGVTELARNTGSDKMLRSFTLIEEDGKIVIRYGIPVHRWITRQAVRFLKDRTTNQALKNELNTTLGVDNQGKPIYIYENSLADGAEHEDTPPRWLNHFYRPTDENPYPIGLFNALEWGVVNNFNDFDYEDARSVYVPDSLEWGKIAYYMLGHVLHLIEDMSLPEHTHLECHDEKYLGWVCGTGSYEWYVTNEIFTNEGDPLPSDIQDNLDNKVDLGRVPSTYTGNAISNNGIVKFNNIGDYIKNLAKISYYLNRHKADLRLRNIIKQGAELGQLGEMFPGLRYDLLGCAGLRLRRWSIPGSTLDRPWLCLDTFLTNGSWWEVTSEKGNNYKREKGFYYIEDTQNARPIKYKDFWNPDVKNGSADTYEGINTVDPEDPQGRLYPLAHLYARDLIPLAIRYVAGAIELFWNETHPVLPFTASGRVTMSDGTGIPGVTMSFTRVTGNGTRPSSVPTNGNGNWSQSGFQSGTTYRVTPSKLNYTFAPRYLPFDSTNSTGLDFTGSVDCNYLISPASRSHGAGVETGSVSVTASCSWTAVSNVNWITITSVSGSSGNGTVNYSVAANSSTNSRQGTMTIAGQTFTVNQAGTIDLPPPTLNTVTQKCDGTTPGIELQWSAVSGATYYEIWRNGILIYTTQTAGT